MAVAHVRMGDIQSVLTLGTAVLTELENVTSGRTLRVLNPIRTGWQRPSWDAPLLRCADARPTTLTRDKPYTNLSGRVCTAQSFRCPSAAAGARPSGDGRREPLSRIANRLRTFSLRVEYVASELASSASVLLTQGGGTPP